MIRLFQFCRQYVIVVLILVQTTVYNNSSIKASFVYKQHLISQIIIHSFCKYGKEKTIGDLKLQVNAKLPLFSTILFINQK